MSECQHPIITQARKVTDGTPFQMVTGTCPDCGLEFRVGEEEKPKRPSEQIKERAEEIERTYTGTNNAHSAYRGLHYEKWEALLEFLDHQAGFPPNNE